MFLVVFLEVEFMFGFYGGQLKRFMVFIKNKIDNLNLNLGTSLWKASTI